MSAHLFIGGPSDGETIKISDDLVKMGSLIKTASAGPHGKEGFRSCIETDYWPHRFANESAIHTLYIVAGMSTEEAFTRLLKHYRPKE